MLPIILSAVLVLTMIISIFTVIRKRKKLGITGFKTALTSICFYLVAVVNLLAYWLDFMGIISWVITVALLLLGAYFTKYMSVTERGGQT
ncbi:hypothetical protein KO561_03910 [Radiobacillus kanasensis]|uniref:hypothetical protein n=1 Tax=Radiobacillus kanasensis TaxID=2844358 RepID=UPI001E2B8FE9|nr:hypothetical protein [Radiobacillus kanasensis]UFU00119.1 hypothetical protein KO561_03910 [Radiobacillus kanasensis]